MNASLPRRRQLAIACLMAVSTPLAGCGTVHNGQSNPVATVSNGGSPDSFTAHAAAAKRVMGAQGYLTDLSLPSHGDAPDRLEMKKGDALARVTWQSTTPGLADNFPEVGTLPDGSSYRWKETGYGAVSCLVTNGPNAVILTILPPASANGRALVPPGTIATWAHRLLASK